MIFRKLCDIFRMGRESMNKNKKVFSFLDVTIIVAMCSLVMCFLGAALIYKHLGGVNFSLMGEDKGLQELIGAYNTLIDNYYDEVNTTDLIKGAIDGMYQVVGDPYTTYLDQNSTDSLNSSLNGKIEGIGVLIGQNEEDGKLVIMQVFEDGPAEKAGMQVGDILTHVNGKETKGKSSTDVSKEIKANKTAKLTVDRNGQAVELEVTIGTALVPAVYSHTFLENGKRVGYLQLTVFSDTADVQFSKHLKKLEEAGIDSLIIDLRDNTGGYLEIAKTIAELFIEKGKTIYSLERKDSTQVTKDETSEKRTYDIDILINKRSASASEILAGALKYSYGAKLVGTTSFGKGKVQEKSNLSSGTSIKVTTARWLVPNGECIDGVGLTPDIEVELDTENRNPEDLTSDNQIMSAVKDLAE